MTVVNPDSGSETKSGYFSWNIIKSDFIFQWSQNTKTFPSLSYVQVRPE